MELRRCFPSETRHLIGLLEFPAAIFALLLSPVYFYGDIFSNISSAENCKDTLIID